MCKHEKTSWFLQRVAVTLPFILTLRVGPAIFWPYFVNTAPLVPAADVDFTSLARFRRSIYKVDLSDFVKWF